MNMFGACLVTSGILAIVGFTYSKNPGGKLTVNSKVTAMLYGASLAFVFGTIAVSTGLDYFQGEGNLNWGILIYMGLLLAFVSMVLAHTDIVLPEIKKYVNVGVTFGAGLALFGLVIMTVPWNSYPRTLTTVIITLVVLLFGLGLTGFGVYNLRKLNNMKNNALVVLGVAILALALGMFAVA